MVSQMIRYLRGSIVLIMLMTLIVAASVTECHGATLKTIPGTDLRVSFSNKLILGNKNYTAKWSGISGKVAQGSDGSHTLCVPIKSRTKSFTYKDFLDLNYSNVGSINGRQIDAKIHFNSMTVGTVDSRSAAGERSDGYFAVCYMGVDSLWISSTIGMGGGYRAAKSMDVTTTMYWHDTGKTVNLPFFQCLSDIDAAADYYTETWTAGSGFSGIFYKYSPCALSFSGNKVIAPGMDAAEDESLIKCGLYAPTTGGSFRGVFTEGNCATQFIIYNAYALMNNPVKTSDAKSRNEEGDAICYTIDQKVGKFYADTMTTYSSFVMTDELPQGLRYEGAAVYDGSGKDITSQGSLNYDETSRTVTFSMGSSWLTNIANYTGQTLSLKIKTVVEPPDVPMKSVNNFMTTTIDKEVKLTSDEAAAVLAVPYHAKYEYVSETAGRKLPEEISTETGDYKIADDAVYYKGDTVNRKEMPQDGTIHKILDSTGAVKGSWILKWDAETLDVSDADVLFTGSWRYVPSPRLVITKSIYLEDLKNAQAHGYPTFLFKITGESSGKVWYRSLTFSEESIRGAKAAAAKSGEKYLDEDGNAFQISGEVICASSAAVPLPEDEYLVEELTSLRFEALEATCSYVGDFGIRQADKGVNSAKISLNLSRLSPKDDGYDASYAEASFTNKKTYWGGYSHTDLVINALEKGAR